MDIIYWIGSLFVSVIGVLRNYETSSGFVTFLIDLITPILYLNENMQEMGAAMNSLRSTAIEKDKEATAGRILRGDAVNKGLEKLLVDARMLFDEVHRLNADFKSFQDMEWKEYLRALPTMHRMSRSALILKEKMAENGRRLGLGGEKSGNVVDMFPSGKVMKEVNQLWSWSEGNGMGKLVCVSGMGGVGKTRLFEELHKKILQDRHPAQVVMIKVSERMQLKTIQRDIARKLMLGWVNKDQEVLASRISDTLEENGEYVFLFDDVWKELPLSSIGIRCNDDEGTIPKSCMVVFSTRIFSLSGGANYSIRLQCLQQLESWSLFVENIEASLWENIGTNRDIRKLAMQIVEECEGLPLALVNAGKAFSEATEVKDWKHVEEMKREPWKVPRMEGNVLQVLRRSYDKLDNDCLKLCFTYLALMPTHLDESWFSWLTFYWIGERVIEHWTDLDDANRKRDKLIQKLREVGLVADGDPPKLHKMIRAMAVWLGIFHERYIAMPGMGLTIAQQGGDISWNDAKRISLLHNDIHGGWPQEPNCPELFTLLIRQKGLYCATLDSRFFQGMCSLRVLDLCALKDLPKSIRQLGSLEFLHLSSAKIASLPKELGELVNLRFLNLNGSRSLRDVPSDLFRRLKKLEYLGLYDTYINWQDRNGARVEELYDLKHLKVLGITFTTTAALEALLVKPPARLKSVTDSIVLREMRSIKLPENLGKDLKKLKRLKISHCVDLEEIFFKESDENGGSIENLSEMELYRLEKVRIMFRGELVKATDNNDPTFSWWSLLVSRIINWNRPEIPPPDHERCYLRNLKILKISSCKMLEELVMHGREGLFTFPMLKELWLEDLPELTSICKVPLEFPSLRILRVVGCPKLRKLPLGEECGRVLSEIKGCQEWWDNLDWEDGGENLRSHFAQFFRQVS